MMSKSILALVVAAAFSAQANAGTVGTAQYTITYDDSFWGITTGTDSDWISNRNTLTFSSLGLSATASGSRLGSDRYVSEYYVGYSPITITAVEGFSIASITTGLKGRLDVKAGEAQAANASVNAGLQWVSLVSSEYGWYSNYVDTNSGTPNGTYKYTGSITTTFAAGAGEGGDPAAVALGVASQAVRQTSMSGGVKSATLDSFYAEVNALAQGQGAKSTSLLNSVSFTVAVVPSVPEPESYAMMLAGLGLMATIARRRSKAKAV